MAEHYPDPFDYYDEFNEWIMGNRPCGNGEQLLRYFEDEFTFTCFLESKGIIEK